MAGVQVQLLDADGQVLASRTTDADGHYLFNGLLPGHYSVAVAKPEGYTFTAADAGGGRPGQRRGHQRPQRAGLPGPGRRATARWTPAWVVAAPKAHLGNRVWEDSNRNGVQDDGESGILGAQILLKNADGQVIDQTTTDADGRYGFDVDAGTYSLQVVVPVESGYVASPQDAGGDDSTDSDIDASGNTGLYTLAAGEVNDSIDMGGYRPALVQPKASLGDKVWLDANRNGLQDSGEAGVAGVEVVLLDASGNPVADRTQTTDAEGNYLFDGLSAGTYAVRFTGPDGYTFTGRDALGNLADGLDSDVDATGATAAIELAPGQDLRSVDAGLVTLKTASIGDRVWEDMNYNGVQDTGEAGLAGVTVNLLDASGSLVGTTTTNASGNYLFDQLEAGDFKVQVVKPSGYHVTKANIGFLSADSDIGVDGSTSLIRLEAGQAITDVDAGLYRKATIGDQVWWDHNHSGTKDLSLEDQGFSGVTVRLLNADNQVVATTRSGTNGYYRFTDVDPGSYRLEFSAAGATIANAYYGATNASTSTWLWGQKDIGSNDALDSDASAGSIAAATRTSLFSVQSGQVDLSRDVAVTPIVVDLNRDGKITVTGETTSIDKSGIGAIGRTVSFDIDADGRLDNIEWIDGQGDGLLVDTSRIGPNNAIDGNALFGDLGGQFNHGYEKLALHDANGDGTVSGDELAQLGVWVDDGDAVLEAGELLTAAQAGLSAVSARMQLVHDDAGRVLMQSSAEVGGQTVLTEDVWFAVAPAALPSASELLGPDAHALDQLLANAGLVGAAPGAPAAADLAHCAVGDLVDVADVGDAAEVLRLIAALQPQQQHELAAC